VSNLAARAALAFGVILGIGVVLITGNTIRVGIQGRRDEIEVAKLCGATDAYVRRPFLYSGALQGLLGAFVAVALVASVIALLSGPTETLTALSSSNMQLVNISTFSLISVLCVGAALGLIGAWIAVSAYLRQVDVTRSV
jgi:cell division transport system permease protein